MLVLGIKTVGAFDIVHALRLISVRPRLNSQLAIVHHMDFCAIADLVELDAGVVAVVFHDGNKVLDHSFWPIVRVVLEVDFLLRYKFFRFEDFRVGFFESLPRMLLCGKAKTEQNINGSHDI